jgi:hypothetical protein
MILRILIAILITSACWLYTLNAEARNEYLNDHPGECRTGEIDVSIYQREQDYRTYDTSDYDEDSVRLTFRKYLGNLQCNQKNDLHLENMRLKQQLELFKMCTKFKRNPSFELNPNFALLASKCSGIVNVNDDNRPKGNHWENLKKEYIKENPGEYMGTKILIPEDLDGPLPEPVDEEAEWNAID